MDPFASFFDTDLAISATRAARTHKTSVKACVFDAGLAEVYDDDSAASEIRKISVHIRRSGPGAWNIPSTRPQAGDLLTLPDSRGTFRVTSVSMMDANEYILEARET